jgi:hypothetical protein
VPHASEPGAYGISCHKIKHLSAVIDFTFTAQDGSPFNLTIPSSGLNVGPFADDPAICQTLINGFDLVPDINLVGGRSALVFCLRLTSSVFLIGLCCSLLKHYYRLFPS